MPQQTNRSRGHGSTRLTMGRVIDEGSRAIRTVSVCLALLLTTGAVRGEESAEKSPSKNKNQVISLFDGKTLTGWKVTNFGSEKEVQAVEGTLELEMGDPLTGVTIDPKFFEKLPKVNYEITLEAKRVLGGDFFVGLTFPVKQDSCSLILGGWGGGLVGISSIDSFDASENETTTYHGFKNDQWYRIRLRVTEDRILAWLDDKPIVSLETTDKKLSTRIEVTLSEPLGLCTFQTTARYRDFKMRPLTAQELKKPDQLK